jgi:hypothetical protein
VHALDHIPKSFPTLALTERQAIFGPTSDFAPVPPSLFLSTVEPTSDFACYCFVTSASSIFSSPILSFSWGDSRCPLRLCLRALTERLVIRLSHPLSRVYECVTSEDPFVFRRRLSHVGSTSALHSLQDPVLYKCPPDCVYVALRI